MNAVSIVPFIMYVGWFNEDKVLEAHKSIALKQAILAYRRGETTPADAWVLEQTNNTHLYFESLEVLMHYLKKPNSDCHVRYLAEPGTPKVFPGDKGYEDAYMTDKDAFDIMLLNLRQKDGWQ